jgi:hypothetical protein
MKKTISILLITSMLSVPMYCEKAPPAPTISPEVMAELNKPIERSGKVDTGGWIWISVFTVVGIVFGSWAYNTKRPI